MTKKFFVVFKSNVVYCSIPFQLFNMSQHMTSRNDSSNPNLSLSDPENTPDRLLDIVKYLKREKDVLNGKVKVIEAESSRLKLELETTRRELVQHSSTLEAAAERAQIENALPSIKFKNLQVFHFTLIITVHGIDQKFLGRIRVETKFWVTIYFFFFRLTINRRGPKMFSKSLKLRCRE